MAAKYNITIDEGATYKVGFTFRHDDDSLWDLTYCSVNMKIKNKHDGNISIDVSEYFTLGGETGTAVLAVPANVFSNIGFIRGVYDLEIVNNQSTEVTKMLYGTVLVNQEVV